MAIFYNFFLRGFLKKKGKNEQENKKEPKVKK